MPYCSIHSIKHRSDYCPRCVAEERHRELLETADEHHRELIETTESGLEQSDYRRANPGDYKCPHCKYVSLNNGATLCPLCRGDVGRAYWQAIEEREAAARIARQRKLEEEAAAEKREEELWAARRRAPEYLAQEEARIAKGELRRSRANASEGMWVGMIIGGLLIGILGFGYCVRQTPGLEPLGPSSFNLYTGVFLGAIVGAVIGRIIGGCITK